jgi:hypothetical protein
VASCETLNIGGKNIPDRFTITGVTLSPTAPAGGYVAGTQVTATIAYQGVTPPFTFVLSFPNGGATPATQTVIGNNGTATATFTIDSFLLADEADGKDIAFTVEGSDGSGVEGDFSGTFHVVGIPNQPPVINSATVNGTTVTVDATDLDNEDITVTFSATGGLSGSPTSAVIAGGSGTAVFNFSGDDLFGGNTGDVTFTATDPANATDTETVSVSTPSIVLAADTLYAIPLSGTAAVGAPVRVVVASGDPANPFFYMTGVRLTADQGANFNYVANSFNVGAVGGAAGDPDGIWTDQGATNFLLAPDNFIQRSDAGGGLHGIDFNVTPLDGSDMAAGEGELFNIEVTFGAAGTWQLGFQDVNVVNRTYYQDSNQAPDYFWGDITNNHAGVPNSVTVN